MGDITTNTVLESYNDNLPIIKCIYQNNTRCRFNVYGLKNSPLLSSYLINVLENVEGIRETKPSTTTGNVLIIFNSHKTTQNEIFFKLTAEVQEFIQKRSTSSQPVNRKLKLHTYEAENHTTDRCHGKCSSCQNECNNNVLNSINVKPFLTYAVSISCNFLLQRIARKFIRQSLYRLIF